MSKIELTKEQSLILKSEQNNIVIQALAGSGKTTTLLEYSKKYSDKKFLYLAFNRSIKEEAEKKFPINVTAKTVHALARSWFVNSGYNPEKIKNFIRTKYYHDFLSFKKATYDEIYLCTNVLKEFFIGSEINITEDFVKKTSLIKKDEKNYAKKIKRICLLANLIWDNFKEKNNNILGYTHDVYLKLYQINKIQITGFDVILFDESQDSNDVITDIVISQKNAKKIFVGDKHQAIYQFRGAKDALTDYEKKADVVLSLTKTFRFGNNLALFASKFLKNYKQENRVMSGLENICTLIKTYEKPKESLELINQFIKNGEGVTKIFRTNSKLLENLDFIINKMKLPFFINGDLSKYKFDTCLDIYYFINDRKKEIKEFFFLKFKDIRELKEYASSSQEKEISEIIELVETQRTNNVNTEEFITKIKRESEKNKKEYLENNNKNMLILTTAHVSKGLEWDNVILSNDFLNHVKYIYFDEKTQKNETKSIFSLKKIYCSDKSKLTKDELDFYELTINLLYVSITRAKKSIYIPNELHGILYNNS